MAFTPFMQGSEAQGIISNYLGGNYASSPNVNTAGQFRNPIFDIRTQQELAGDLDPSALFPNPHIDFSVEDTPADPCREGYMLVDGICQPIETFGESSYSEREQSDYEKRLEEENKLYIPSQEEMEAMTAEEYLDNLRSRGWMSTKDGIEYFDPTNIGSAVGKQFDMRLGMRGNTQAKIENIIKNLIAKEVFAPSTSTTTMQDIPIGQGLIGTQPVTSFVTADTPQAQAAEIDRVIQESGLSQAPILTSSQRQGDTAQDRQAQRESDRAMAQAHRDQNRETYQTAVERSGWSRF